MYVYILLYIQFACHKDNTKTDAHSLLEALVLHSYPKTSIKQVLWRNWLARPAVKHLNLSGGGFRMSLEFDIYREVESSSLSRTVAYFFGGCRGDIRRV